MEILTKIYVKNSPRTGSATDFDGFRLTWAQIIRKVQGKGHENPSLYSIYFLAKVEAQPQKIKAIYVKNYVFLHPPLDFPRSFAPKIRPIFVYFRFPEPINRYIFLHFFVQKKKPKSAEKRKFWEEVKKVRENLVPELK